VLLSVGRDGVLCVFDVKDKEPRLRKDGKELPSVIPGEETLLPRQERDKFREALWELRREIRRKKEAYEEKIMQ
jgi:hypothetical protein